MKIKYIYLLIIISVLQFNFIHSIEKIETIHLNGEYNDEIIINKQNNFEYIFIINNTEFIYFFESEEYGYIHYDSNISCPKLCAGQYGINLHINMFKNATDKDIKIKINSIKVNYNETRIISISPENKNYNKIMIPQVKNTIYIFQTFSDYIFYTNSFNNKTSLKCAFYNSDMLKDDIINSNDSYFDYCYNEIKEVPKDNIFIISIQSESNNKAIQILFQQKLIYNDFKIINNEINFFYLNKEKGPFILNFEYNTIKRYLKLSNLSLNSEIKITEKNTENFVIIDKNNKYYIFNESIFKGEIILEIIKGEDALFEFVFNPEQNNIKVLDSVEYFNHEITTNYTIIKFDENTKNKDIFLDITSKNPFKLLLLSGISKNNCYHDSPDLKPSNYSKEFKTEKLLIYNEDINIEENEYFYVLIKIESKYLSDKYKIKLTKFENLALDKINVDINEEKCKKAINITKEYIKDAYIFTDIKKNSPDPDYFGKADLISDLDKIEINNRKYYEFFRDIRKIISKNKDAHFIIAGKKSPNGFNLDKMVMCLPFKLYIKDDNDPKIFIEKFECYKYFNNNVQEFIDNHLNSSIKSINGKDPFDYIQNFTNFFSLHHSSHATFTMNMLFFHQVPICHLPLTKEELSNIEFEFDDHSKLSLDYYLYDLDYDIELANDEKFEEYFMENLYINLNPFLILEIVSRYKNLQDENLFQNINWKYKTPNNKIRCVVDINKTVNVLVATSLDYDDFSVPMKVMDNCSDAFYNNDYPIVAIMSLNNGGRGKLGFHLLNSIQPKIVPKLFLSTKKTKLLLEMFNPENIQEDEDVKDIGDSENCKPLNVKDMKEIEDDYGEGIIHKRTQTFTLISKKQSKEYKKRRQYLFENNRLKRPTDIIVFTDSYSFSATSFFIKGLQEIGGAIIVGYYGNPKVPGKFDASQSTSGDGYFDNTDIENIFNEVGFQSIGITVIESFNYTCQNKNPIPREFLVKPVDERVNISELYDDSKYDKFIEKAKEIFIKYNKENKCNKDNPYLLFEPNDKECYKIENDSYAHGGYECNKDTGEWSNLCKPFYCDIGYYFDVVRGKCIKDLCTEEAEENTDDEFPLWAIIVIIIGSVIIIGLIIGFIIFKCLKSKKNREGNMINNVSLIDYKKINK